MPCRICSRTARPPRADLLLQHLLRPPSRPHRCRSEWYSYKSRLRLSADYRICRSDLRSDGSLERRRPARSTSSPSFTGSEPICRLLLERRRCRVDISAHRISSMPRRAPISKSDKDLLLYAHFQPGLPRRRRQRRARPVLLRERRAGQSTSPTRSTISRWAGSRRCLTGA